ncbi:MAG: hypothetical protein J7L46_03440 [Bacteroidales bacterium]|nr:hypothetical protein [Bacteroidales bacterium]
MEKILPIVFLLFFSSCRKENIEINNLNNNKVCVLGHGGMGSEQIYPIDSYQSILKCLFVGADGTEMDVQMTKDSVLVAFHDPDLSDKTNLKGVINSLTWNEIKNTKYTTVPYADYKVVSLNELFDNMGNIHNYMFSFDCKLYTVNSDLNQFYDIFIRAIDRLVDQYSLRENVLIESTSASFLKKFEIFDNSYKLFYYPSSFEQGLKIATDWHFYGITISTEHITCSQVEIAHDNNLFVTIWGIHSRRGNTDAVAKNPDFIQTDRVKHLVKYLK